MTHEHQNIFARQIKDQDPWTLVKKEISRGVAQTGLREGSFPKSSVSQTYLSDLFVLRLQWTKAHCPKLVAFSSRTGSHQLLFLR